MISSCDALLHAAQILRVVCIAVVLSRSPLVLLLSSLILILFFSLSTSLICSKIAQFSGLQVCVLGCGNLSIQWAAREGDRSFSLCSFHKGEWDQCVPALMCVRLVARTTVVCSYEPKLNQAVKQIRESRGRLFKKKKNTFLWRSPNQILFQWGMTKAPAIRYELGALLECSVVELTVGSCGILGLVSCMSCWN